MYVTVRRSKHFGGTDEIARRAKEGLVPTLKTLPGFVSYDILSLEDNVVMGITIFDNEASAEEANKSFVLWAREQDLRSLLEHSARPATSRFIDNRSSRLLDVRRCRSAEIRNQS